MPTPSDICIHYLQQLSVIIEKIKNFDPKGDLITKVPAAGMFPMLEQAKITVGFALRSCLPLVGQDPTALQDTQDSYDAVQTQIEEVIAQISVLSPQDFADHRGAQIQHRAGFADLTMGAEAYFQTYALPNLIFHLSMVYVTAKQAGVPLGKADFDGFHSYPKGFSF